MEVMGLRGMGSQTEMRTVVSRGKAITVRGECGAEGQASSRLGDEEHWLWA